MTTLKRPSHIFVCGVDGTVCFLLGTDEKLSHPFTSGNNLRAPFAVHYLWDRYTICGDVEGDKHSLTRLSQRWGRLPVFYIDSLEKFILFQRMLCQIEANELDLDSYNQEKLIRLLKARSEQSDFLPLRVTQYRMRCAIECNV